LTQVTDNPGGSAAARVTQFFVDWRNRVVASKQGVQGTEDTTTHRLGLVCLPSPDHPRVIRSS
jgi:hypothetical protein